MEYLCVVGFGMNSNTEVFCIILWNCYRKVLFTCFLNQKIGKVIVMNDFL